MGPSITELPKQNSQARTTNTTATTTSELKHQLHDGIISKRKYNPTTHMTQHRRERALQQKQHTKLVKMTTLPPTATTATATATMTTTTMTTTTRTTTSITTTKMRTTRTITSSSTSTITTTTTSTPTTTMTTVADDNEATSTGRYRSAAGLLFVRVLILRHRPSHNGSSYGHHHHHAQRVCMTLRSADAGPARPSAASRARNAQS